MEELLLTSLCTAYAQHQGERFLCRSFTQTSYVKLTTSPSQLCLCACDFILHWTERKLFSLAVPSEANGFFLLQPCEGAYRLNDKGTAPTMVGLPDSENEWNSTRSTWDSNGMTTMWVNGKRSDREILQHLLSGTPSIILGLKEETLGSGGDMKRERTPTLDNMHVLPSQGNMYALGIIWVTHLSTLESIQQ
uniref:Pentraxin (PTX) domain-containing protein n=1 Tax=Neolamprologus brichardi TaxID=32507 RepID=A0A3Q4IEW2_NEOBR